MKLMIHELTRGGGSRARRSPRAVLQDPRARQAHPEAALRAVGRARDADPVRVRRSSGRRSARPPDSSRRSTAQSSSCSATSTPARSRRSGTTRRHSSGSTSLLRAPSLYDEFLRYLARRGLPVPAACLERDFTQPYERNPELVGVFKIIYDDTRAMVGRLRHVREARRHRGELPAVALPPHEDGGAHHRAQDGHRRLLGRRPSCKRALDLSFFPELIDVRTVIGSAGA